MTESIKFYYNGIRINGEKKLIRCYYSLDNNKDHAPSVSISARDYDHLPADLFEVHNDSDSMSDYYDSDRAYLTPEHPLYKYARYAAAKAAAHMAKRCLPKYEKCIADPFYNTAYYTKEAEACRERIARFEAMEDPGHPTESDMEAVRAMRLDAESARIAAEHAAELAKRELVLNARANGRRFIESVAAEHPIKEGEPVVTIEWSECPAFYSWEDGELKLSVAAAEIVLRHYDEERHETNVREGHGGYYKTKFTIDYVMAGEAGSYTGRYDLGDNDGGLIEHIRAFGSSVASRGSLWNGKPTQEDKDMGESIVALAGVLEAHTAMRKKKDNVVQFPSKRQNSPEEAKTIVDAVKRMTDQELEAAIFLIDPKDSSMEEVANFFLLQLGMRDIRRALEVCDRWKAQ